MKMKLKYTSILICILCTFLPISAQNTISSARGSSASGRDLGTHDRNGNPIDTTAVTDAKTIPIGLYQWKVTRRLGNIDEPISYSVYLFPLSPLVEMMGFEPMTPCLQGRCSPN